MNKFKFFISFIAVITNLALFSVSGSASAKEYFTISEGQLQRPTGFREWIFVGAPVTPNDMNDGKAPFPEFHNVYIDPGSWEHWKKNGNFRDGTILIKELVSVGSKAAPSGKGYFMGEFIGLEATIKSKQAFPDEPGNWAYFTFSTPDHQALTKSASAMPKESCNSCHQATASDDFVFNQYYPILRAAKANPSKAVGGE